MKIKKERSQVMVVGIGASAGGLEPLQMLLTKLPPKLPTTAIIVAQHLSPDYKSMLVELLGRKTSIPVSHIENGMDITGNTIYIAPANADVVVVDNKFTLQSPSDVGAHPSADILFTSLAKAYGKHSCGIVLSGTGKDGTRGIISIKKAGGITIVQDPSTARYEGMPKSAVNSGVVDYVLSPEQIGEQFQELLSNKRVKTSDIKDFASLDTVDTFTKIFDLLERRIGIDFSDYKISTLSRRLEKRITEKKFDSEEEYLDYIRQNPEELEKLFELILIGVTSFFRDAQIFRESAKLLEKIIREKKSGETFRLWIPGCATGEEAYTYAIIINEILEKTHKMLPVQIFATDIDIRALHKARLGIYQAAALQGVPKPWLAKYFSKINGTTYELNKEIRKMVLYSRHDVTSNPPFLRLDMVSCRNLLIYFNNDLQKRVLPLFYYALNPEGYLVLGKSENIGQFQNLFATVDSSNKIFQRKPTDGKIIKFPHFRPTKSRRIIPAEKNVIREDMTVSEMVKETLYNSFEYPYVVIDENMDIVEVNGEVSRYLKFKPGSAALNFMKFIIPELQIESRAVIGKAITNMKVEKGNARKLPGSEPAYVRLTVKPLLYAKTNNPYFVVIFEEIKLDDKLFRMSAEVIEEKESPRMIELEQELDATKEHMNSLVEELETSNEELQALNEEMQASNEELQASNEELETSNEELQATNEELENAYTELREASKQIAKQKEAIEHSAENLSTLLNNTLVGFILIDRDYKVITCNKIASHIYKSLFNTNLKPGISFIKVLPGNIFPAFHQHFKKALEGEQVVTEERIEVKNNGVRYFDFNYTPVKLEKDEIESRLIAVSFIDITNRKQAELSLKSANEQLIKEQQFIRTLAESLPNIVWTTDEKGKYLYYNQQFMDYTGKTFEEIQTLTWKPFIHEEDWKKTKQLWNKSLKTGEKFVIEHRIRNRQGNYKWHLTLATAIKNPDGSSHIWVGTSTDIHEQKLLDQKKNEFISIASHELKTPVTSLKGYTQVLHVLMKRNDTSRLASTLLKIDAQLDRLTDLINDLLDVSRIESGKLQMTKKSFSFDALIAEVAESMQLTSEQHKIIQQGTVGKTVYSDRDRIEQVMINLISNAIKYSPKGRIVIRSAMNHKDIIVSVTDSGIGIPKAKQDKVFGRFFRVSDDDSITMPGMGLGLYISSEIIKRLGGRIWFESKEGKGSTFYFTVPVNKSN